MTYQQIIRGQIVTPERVIRDGWVAIHDGRIAALGNGPHPDAHKVHDAGQAYVMPGVVDGQTHAGSYGGLPGLEATTRSAVAGGVTTIVDMPYDSPAPLCDPETLNAKVEAVERFAHCDCALYATLLPGQSVDMIAPLIAGGVAAFKISAFEANPTRFPRIPADMVLDMFTALSRTAVPLGLHNEDQEIVRTTIARMKAEGRDGIACHSPSRPVAAEMASSAHFLELGFNAGAHAHLVHISHARGFDMVAHYKADGGRATGETCVHYLWFDPDEDGPALGARMKVNPPIRPGERERLWEKLLEDRIDFVSSDHASWPLSSKETGSIFTAGAGIPGLETLLPAFFTAASERNLDAPLLAAKYLCERPARFFGLWPRKGSIRIGADADLVVLEQKEHTWDSANAHDGLCWSPYDGAVFKGAVTKVWLRGQLAWDGASIVNSPGDGQYVRREDAPVPA
ncbi:dihydroorotase family protein [Komagataeibacter xylinus]|uniref:Amidohydrolase family protein n=1 Tax=Komagataeibacter xylinus TaxID=28448 RepID=A0A857FPZ5_KOMXY|nr:amidohydrolase family protein [Komagataeibacter xylinus]QHC35297.1 amidohydrolase family protein [Komagataeibacter xylinus]